MLGLLYEIFKFLLGIANGEYNKRFFDILLFFLVLVVTVKIIFEITRKDIDIYLMLVLEKIFWNILGIIFYISMYMFFMRLFSNIPLFDFNETKSGALGEMGILSHVGTILIIPLSFLILKVKKTNVKITLLLLQALLVLLLTKVLTSIFMLNNILSYPLWGIQILQSLVDANILDYYSSEKVLSFI